MVTRPALSALNDFIANPSPHNASRLVQIPSLYDLLQHENTLRKGYSAAIMSVCSWIYERGRSVLDHLLEHALPTSREELESETDWSKVKTVQILPIDRLIHCFFLDWLLL
jgi:hypothetical protein